MDLLIHGIVLFPNTDNFMDQITVEIFLSGNSIPFLLADIYYSLQERHEKKEGIYCVVLLSCMLGLCNISRRKVVSGLKILNGHKNWGLSLLETSNGI